MSDANVASTARSSDSPAVAGTWPEPVSVSARQACNCASVIGLFNLPSKPDLSMAWGSVHPEEPVIAMTGNRSDEVSARRCRISPVVSTPSSPGRWMSIRTTSN